VLDRIVGNGSYGCRQHYLRFRVPHTWRIQEQLGILYDTSMTFADHAGFRCGYCLPFRPFDLLENRVLNLWELPLTVMEGSLQNKDYQKLSPEQAYEQIVSLIEAVRKQSGIFVLLWHNSALDKSGEWAGWRNVYQQAINYAHQDGTFCRTGREIIECWGRQNV